MLLSIDTSTAQVGVALLDGGQLVVESLWNSRVHHTVELAPAVAQLLGRAGATPGDVTGVVVAIGPGSFTALRVGMAFAKGFSLAHKVGLIGVPTLDILAGAQPPSNFPLAALLQAGRGRVALNWYKFSVKGQEPQDEVVDETAGTWVSKGKPEITTVDLLAKSITKTSIVAGELSEDERQRLARKRARVVLAPVHLCVRRPAILAEIGWKRLLAGQVDNAATLAPIYLHTGEPIPA
ncbi:MAG TPA: tRNA (adenosine(37)-N6)-threonylcarbamoyltransferase complex dimerization subunit type 1 TsaB [Anaerolineales bacterium]|nr:tRNA (adenosine(37)-N6)-threonylcarbamoyltransferase complex dimerization subunit type 1 TsaB [Anaerolineales bacterium]